MLKQCRCGRLAISAGNAGEEKLPRRELFPGGAETGPRRSGIWDQGRRHRSGYVRFSFNNERGGAGAQGGAYIAVAVNFQATVSDKERTRLNPARVRHDTTDNHRARSWRGMTARLLEEPFQGPPSRLCLAL
jgi:hypothetical protein